MDAGDNIIMLKREILNIKHTKEKSRTRYIRKWREERGWFRVVNKMFVYIKKKENVHRRVFFFKIKK